MFNHDLGCSLFLIFRGSLLPLDGRLEFGTEPGLHDTVDYKLQRNKSKQKTDMLNSAHFIFFFF